MQGGWPRRLTVATLAAFAVEAASGIALACWYEPDAFTAHDSLRALGAVGAFVRSLHWLGAGACIALPLATLLVAFYRGAYRDRPNAWTTGVGLLLLVALADVTGRLLPWDEQAFFSTRVRADVIGLAPTLGSVARTALLGGDDVTGATLVRQFWPHVTAMPVLLALLAWLHARAARSKRAHSTAAITVGALCVAAALVAAPLGRLAVPSDTAFEPWPEWHMLWLGALLRWTPAEWHALPAFWLPHIAIVATVLLPQVERGPRRRRAAVVLVTAGLVVGTAVSLVELCHRPAPVAKLPAPHGMTAVERAGYAAARAHGCCRCHAWNGRRLGGDTAVEDAPDFAAITPGAATCRFDRSDPAQRDAIDAFIRRLRDG